jgi:uncharacterized DUF497 family protein
MRYKHKNFTEKYLNGGEVTVAYNPDDVSCVWLIENGIYIRFELVENRFQGKELSEVKAIRKEKNKMINDEKHNTIQGRINLGNYIESIASTATKQDNVNIKSVRKTRRKEQNKAHTNNPKGGSVNGQ